MEHVEFSQDEEWDSFSRMFPSEEVDFTLHFLGQFSFPQQHDEGLNSHLEIPSRVCLNEGLLFSSQDSYSSGCSSSVFNHNSSPENYYFSDSNNPIMVTNDVCLAQNPNFSDFGIMEEKNSNGLRDSENMKPSVVAINDTEIQLKRKSDMVEINTLDSKKKNRVSTDVQKGKKNVQPKKKQKLTYDKEESSSNYSTDDEKAEGASFESKGVEALNSNGKTRASRGSATDPQSLYARKRRERINERLRILQHLVPNGTKVDISTMLEEAVNYVKFLQLQIKLLSSDDMWMYAPIAYNGMDIGLHREISPLQ